MSILPPQHYKQLGRRLGIPETVLAAAIKVFQRIRTLNAERAVVFTLAHLALEAGVSYKILRQIVGRRGSDQYREFFVAKTRTFKKQKGGRRRSRRRIAVPSPALMKQQRWIVHRILHTAPRHEASVAFHRKADIVEAARLHCGCRWLIKLDVESFFESIYEPLVYKVFAELGYPKLLAFEMTRLCTRIIPWSEGNEPRRSTLQHSDRGPAAYTPFTTNEHAWRNEPGALALRFGSLPQGAPTSPLLANLAVRKLDDAIEAIAASHHLTYTRYADDIALSTNRTDFGRTDAAVIVRDVTRAMDIHGLRPHCTKTRIVPPGARKIVLGLMVDGASPKLTREYRNKLRLHAHMLGTLKIAPSEHAKKLGFHSVLSMRRHIEGKLAHAKRVDMTFAQHIEAQLGAVIWTL